MSHEARVSPTHYSRPLPRVSGGPEVTQAGGVAPSDPAQTGARSRPRLVRQNVQTDPASTRPRHPSPPPASPTRHSPVPPGRPAEPVGQRVMAMHPGAAQRLAATGQSTPFSHSSFHQPQHGILRASRPDSHTSSRSSSRSPSPRGADLDTDERSPSSFPRGASLSPPQPRYGPRLSPLPTQPGTRHGSTSPKPGSRHSSPQTLQSSKPGSPRRGWGGGKGGIPASDDDEELMQVTCV